MVRGNCDYIFLQPIYSKSQRDTLFDMEGVNMDRQEWDELMNEVIMRENLPGNTAQDPKKKVRIMVCADFEDSSIPEEKFYHFTPVPMTMLPKFRLCHAKYWDKKLTERKSEFGKQNEKPPMSLTQLESKLQRL
jgi:hypothetical protein